MTIVFMLARKNQLVQFCKFGNKFDYQINVKHKNQDSKMLFAKKMNKITDRHSFEGRPSHIFIIIN